MKSFYVYIYLDPRKPGKYCYGNYSFDFEPFYVGKGKGYRINVPKDYNSIIRGKINNIQKVGLDYIAHKVEQNLLEEDAFNLEIELISSIGRITKFTGPLSNMTDGGEGASGAIISDEQKKVLSLLKKGKPLSLDHRMKLSESHKGDVPWNKGKKASDDARRNLSTAHQGLPSGMKGKNHSEETRRKLSIARRRRVITKETRKKLSESSFKVWKIRKQKAKMRQIINHIRSGNETFSNCQ